MTDKSTKIDQIAAEVPPSPDRLSQKEILGLRGHKGTLHAEMEHRRTLEVQVEALRENLGALSAEAAHLRELAVKYASYSASNRYLRLAAIVISAVVVLGGCFISQFASTPEGNGQLKLGIGWGLVICGLVIQLVFALFDPHPK